MADLPNIIYRYRPLSEADNTISDREINALTEGKIWLSEPRDFDDPWDCYLGPYLPQLSLKEQNEILQIRVACFTDREDNTRMWSHYANSHQGICVGYKTCGQSLEQWDLKQVKYSNEIPQPPSLTDRESPNAFEFCRALVTTKSADWADQNEFRYVTESRLGPNVAVELDEIASITFGIHCHQDYRKKITTALGTPGRIDFREIYSDPSSLFPLSRPCEEQIGDWESLDAES